MQELGLVSTDLIIAPVQLSSFYAMGVTGVAPSSASQLRHIPEEVTLFSRRPRMCGESRECRKTSGVLRAGVASRHVLEVFVHVVRVIYPTFCN